MIRKTPFATYNIRGCDDYRSSLEDERFILSIDSVSCFVIRDFISNMTDSQNKDELSEKIRKGKDLTPHHRPFKELSDGIVLFTEEEIYRVNPFTINYGNVEGIDIHISGLELYSTEELQKQTDLQEIKDSLIRYCQYLNTHTNMRILRLTGRYPDIVFSHFLDNFPIDYSKIEELQVCIDICTHFLFPRLNKFTALKKLEVHNHHSSQHFYITEFFFFHAGVEAIELFHFPLFEQSVVGFIRCFPNLKKLNFLFYRYPETESVLDHPHMIELYDYLEQHPECEFVFKTMEHYCIDTERNIFPKNMTLVLGIDNCFLYRLFSHHLDAVERLGVKTIVIFDVFKSFYSPTKSFENVIIEGESMMSLFSIEYFNTFEMDFYSNIRISVDYDIDSIGWLIEHYGIDPFDWFFGKVSNILERLNERRKEIGKKLRFVIKQRVFIETILSVEKEKFFERKRMFLETISEFEFIELKLFFDVKECRNEWCPVLLPKNEPLTFRILTPQP